MNTYYKLIVTLIVTLLAPLAFAGVGENFEVTNKNFTRIFVSSTTVGEAIVEVKMKNGIGFVLCPLDSNKVMSHNCKKLSLVPVPRSEEQISLVNAKFEESLASNILRYENDNVLSELQFLGLASIVSVSGAALGSFSSYILGVTLAQDSPRIANMSANRVILGGAVFGSALGFIGATIRHEDNKFKNEAYRVIANDVESILEQTNIALTEVDVEVAAISSYSAIKDSLAFALGHLEPYTNELDGTQFIRFRQD